MISCQKDINVNIPPFEQKLVANCWFTGDGKWYMKVTKTRNLLDKSPIEIVSNAEVKIYEGETLIEILPYLSNGIYGRSNGYCAKVGKTYIMTVSSPGYPVLKATETLLESPDVNDIKLDTINVVTSKNLVGHYATIFLNDNPNTIDFYNILVYRNHITPIETTINNIRYNPGDTVFDDLVHFHVNELIDKQYCHHSSWLVKDIFLSNSSTPTQLLIDHNSFENTISFRFEINSITEAYFKYGSSLGSYISGGLVELTGVAISFTEPMQIKSNVENGYGVFASYNGYEKVIQIE